MGGWGSGRHWWNAKDTTEDRWPLDVRKWQRKGCLVPGTSWVHTRTLNGKDIGSIRAAAYEGCVKLSYRFKTGDYGSEWESREYFVNLERTRCNYGGTRPWFLCPMLGCGRRMAILYFRDGYFACRECLRLAYQSQRESDLDRASRRLQNLNSRLLGWASILDGMPPRPKGMHRRTYDWQSRRYRWLERRARLEWTLRFGPGFDLW